MDKETLVAFYVLSIFLIFFVRKLCKWLEEEVEEELRPAINSESRKE